ncbi:MAG: hypothetical protein WDN23_03765 [Edaphobacter sp.]
MSNRAGLFAAPEHPVESLGVHAEAVTPQRRQNQFGVLVAHLLHRFFHNELLATDDETKRVMVIGYAAALPGLLVSMFLFPAYHGFPPYPLHRVFWSQAGDHYFFAMYSFLVMGAATVYEWDLLFPDLLDIFVLSVLPIAKERLFFGRVLALGIFLALVLGGTSVLGIVVFPLVAEQHNFFRHLLAHVTAVTMSGMFAAFGFLALQGVLLNTVGEGTFRRITPLLQGASIMVLLAILLLNPTISASLEALLNSGSPAVRYFPPFWFLGVYERIMDGPAAPQIFHSLAWTGCYALLLVIAATFVTYPLAYRRRVRQLIEGARAVDSSRDNHVAFDKALHAMVVPLPQQRAVFHFISQTILRYQRQRVTLALFGGLCLALSLSEMFVLRISEGHIRPGILPNGVRAAVPILVFWTIAGLRAVLSAPVDRRGAWVFQIILGRPRAEHLSGTRLWITLWAVVVSVGAILVLHKLSPGSLHGEHVLAGQFIVAVGLSFVLCDLFLYSVRTLPFTHLRKSSITDMPMAIARYFVAFPIFVAVMVHLEWWIEASMRHLIETALLFVVAHLLLEGAQTQSVRRSMLEGVAGETDEFPQSLGLRDA